MGVDDAQNSCAGNRVGLHYSPFERFASKIPLQLDRFGERKNSFRGRIREVGVVMLGCFPLAIQQMFHMPRRPHLQPRRDSFHRHRGLYPQPQCHRHLHGILFRAPPQLLLRPSPTLHFLRHQVPLRRLHHQMKMIAHQAPRMHRPARLGAHFPQCSDEPLPIRVVPEDRFPPISAIPHMVIAPMTSPRSLISGPPLLPGFTVASI